MKKEVLFAILFGLILGLIVTYGIYLARRSLNQPPQGFTTPSPNASGASPSVNPADLTVIAPEDETLQFAKELRVTGTTKPNAHIVVFANNQPSITQADGSGNFTLNLNLEAGSNILTIQSMDEDGRISQLERTVVYATSPLEEEAPAIASASPSLKITPTPRTSARPRVASPTPSPKP